MIDSSIVSSSLATARIFANNYCCFTINAQAFDVLIVGLSVFDLDVVEDGIRLRDFFLGLALSTRRKR